MEQTFGIFIARWGIFWRKLRVPLEKATLSIHVCAKLHNFILNNEGVSAIDVPMLTNEHSSTPSSSTTMDIFWQDECDTDDTLHRRRRDLEVCEIREQFTQEIRAQGLKRPTI